MRLIIVSLIIATIYTQSDADNDRKLKLSACINLVSAALHHDSDFVSTVATTIDFTDKSSLVSKFIAKTLLNCYTTTSLIKSAELISKKFQNISPFANDNKVILALDKFHEKYDKDVNLYIKDLGKLEKVMALMKDELKVFEEFVQTNVNDYYKQDQKNKNEKEEKARREEDERQRGQESGFDYAYLGFLKKINPAVKYGLGLGLLAIIFLGLYLGLKSLEKPADAPRSKKDKNDKKKN